MRILILKSEEYIASYFLNENELRFATPEEIEDYEMMQDTKNFNL